VAKAKADRRSRRFPSHFASHVVVDSECYTKASVALGLCKAAQLAQRNALIDRAVIPSRQSGV
jgi:hypothetical protein